MEQARDGGPAPAEEEVEAHGREPLAEEEEDPKGRALALLRQAVQATIFTIRAKKEDDDEQEPDGVDLGSLLDFLGPEKLGFCGPGPSHTISTCTPATNSKAQLSDVPPTPPAASPEPTPTPPRYFGAGPRRRLPRAGEGLTARRAACPRSMQLRGLLPSIRGAAHEATSAGAAPMPHSARGAGAAEAATPRSGALLPPASTGASPSAPPRARSQDQGPRRGPPPPPRSHFTPGFLAGIAARPVQGRHPLLIAMEEQGDPDTTGRRTGFEAPALLSQQLGERVWEDTRKGFWATPAAWSRAPGEGSEAAALPPAARTAKAGASSRPGRPAASAAERRTTEDMRQLLRVMDAEGRGFVQPELLVMLLFWQGLARRRSAALVVLERAFGHGDVPCAALLQLTDYVDVQVRLVDGLRRLTQRESLEHLCEFVVEGDMQRPRKWFGTMKRDPTGRVDIAQILRWLAQAEIMLGRQDLFRFLSHVDLEASVGDRGGQAQSGGSDYKKRNFRFEDFVCLLCRCTVTWCLMQTVELLSPSASGQGAEGSGAEPGQSAARSERITDREMGKRWAELTRHICVSFFVNRKFWGPEPRQVAMGVRPLRATTIGQELPQEHWMALFQRVRAQGIASILPEGEEAEDPAFLRGLACQSSAFGWAGRRGLAGAVTH